MLQFDLICLETIPSSSADKLTYINKYCVSKNLPRNN